ncbi:MAG: hypothetical protein ACTS5I_01105 [Rhodanobacter sp.]
MQKKNSYGRCEPIIQMVDEQGNPTPAADPAVLQALAMQGFTLKKRNDFSCFIVPMPPLAVAYQHLLDDQQVRVADDQPTSPIPLIWIALANAVGLQVDVETGRIVDGPRNRPSRIYTTEG